MKTAFFVVAVRQELKTRTADKEMLAVSHTERAGMIAFWPETQSGMTQSDCSVRFQGENMQIKANGSLSRVNLP